MWDQKYSSVDYFYGTEPNDFLRSTVSYIKPQGTVLSLGEGEGRNAVFCAQLGFTVTALDQSSVGLNKAQRLAQQSGVAIHICLADLEHYAFTDNTWDAILSIWCHLPSLLRRRVHQALIQSLKPDGVFILECYEPLQLQHQTGGPKDLELLPTLADLLTDFEGHDIQIARAVERTVSEGVGHRGLSCVNQLVVKPRHTRYSQ